MRKNKPIKKSILPDPIHNSKLITRLINKIMLDGKRGVAQKILYNSFEIINKKTSKPAFEVFEEAIKNITPQLELRVRKIGGANYQIPVEVYEERKITLALRWLVNYARLRNEKTMVEKLAHEIIDASNNLGGAIKKKEDTYKMAEANKAFAHYRWK